MTMEWQIDLDDQLKELLSTLMEQGELFIPSPLQGKQIFQLKQAGHLLEQIVPNGFRYSLSAEARSIFTENPDLLKVDYSWLNQSPVVNYGFL